MSDVVSVSNPSMVQFGNITPVHKDPMPPVYFPVGELAARTNSMHVVFKLGETFTSRVEALEKVTKNTHRLLDISLKLQPIASKVLENCSTNLKTAVDLFDSIRIIGMLSLFFSPQKNGKHFLFDKENGCYKKVDRLFLASHLACKSARTLNKWRLLDLGRIAKVKIGQYLSAFTAFTDSLMVGSCIFNILDSSKKLEKFEYQNAVITKRIKKLKDGHRILHLVKEGDEQVITDLKKTWEQKIVKKQQSLKQKNDNFTEHSTSKTKKDIGYLILSILKAEGRLALIASGNHSFIFQELSMDSVNKLDQLRATQEELDLDRRINWVKIAASVSKIAVITLALTFTALNFTAVLPVTALLALGIISDSIGLTKIVMEDSVKKY